MQALAFWKAVTVDDSNLLERFFELLRVRKVRFCLIGGQAVNAYAEPVVSLDLHVVVLASDNMYLYENLETHAPIAQTLDAASNLRTQDRMKSRASEPRLLVPGHDPAVFARFQKVSERIVRIE